MSEGWKDWERRVAQHARDKGLPWDRRLRLGDNHDLLDIDGCLPMGHLVGCKSVRRGSSVGARLFDGMDQAQRAKKNAHTMYGVQADELIGWQILQRTGYPAGRAYAVTEYDDMLALVLELAGIREAAR
ncbi:MAG TPA: hypothetical protein VIX86_05515 [Streptosporangiaceae bacterium]